MYAYRYLKVPLGIETKNEANLKEMAQILTNMFQCMVMIALLKMEYWYHE